MAKELFTAILMIILSNLVGVSILLVFNVHSCMLKIKPHTNVLNSRRISWS